MVLSVFAACQSGKRNIPELRETYGMSDKKPFGAYIAFHQVQDMYNKNTIREKRQSFRNTWSQIADDNALYLLFSPQVYLTLPEVEAMLEYVKKEMTYL
jgi:hypothetical protein